LKNQKSKIKNQKSEMDMETQTPHPMLAKTFTVCAIDFLFQILISDFFFDF